MFPDIDMHSLSVYSEIFERNRGASIKRLKKMSVLITKEGG